MNHTVFALDLTRSNTLYKTATELLPGGTQLLSKRPERFAPGQWPAYAQSARGCEIVDIDGNRFLDFTTSGIGCCTLGYADPDVSEAVIEKVRAGSMTSLNCPEEVELAQMLLALHPWASNVRYSRGGAESLAIAVRLARAGKRRDGIAFCGYHGWADWYLAANLSNGNSLDDQLLPGLNARGVPQGLRDTMHPFHFNCADELAVILRERGDQIAAVVMEPTRSAPPTSGFINEVRRLCDEAGALLIFDEVTTGFRLHSGGYHLTFDIAPDMAVFAKALGNGHPIGAVIGTQEAMDVAREIFVSSTYWTEGVGFAAAIATLKKMAAVQLPRVLAETGSTFIAGMRELAAQHELPLVVSGHPALVHFRFEHAQDLALQTLLTVKMLERGILLGNGFYPTYAHGSEHLEQALSALDESFHDLQNALADGDVALHIGGAIKQSGFARLS